MVQLPLSPLLLQVAKRSTVISTKSFARETAFTLLELILTLLILSVLSLYAVSKFSSVDPFKKNKVAAQIISAARLSQQLSMNDSSRNFVLILQANQIDLQINGISFTLGSVVFPMNIDSNISISPASNILFDSFGRTSPQVINVTGNSSQSICFESSGYINLC